MISIEPHPSDRLKQLSQVNLIQSPVQTIPMETFESLERNDVLFIDSSHTVKPAGDVNFLVLEVLPRLKPGVVVHFHDIYLPYDYPRDTLQTFFHGMETSLLHAFLIFNTHAEIIFCLSQLHYGRSEILGEVFPQYSPEGDDRGLRLPQLKAFQTSEQHFPSSLYIQII
jgi:hypothetical protein